MNVFGIGTLELLVILLVAFIALGPGKTMEVARTIGRMVREARRTFTDIMDAASLDDRSTADDRSAASRPPPQSQRPPPTTPPADPLPAPPNLAEQKAGDDARPPDSR